MRYVYMQINKSNKIVAKMSEADDMNFIRIFWFVLCCLGVGGMMGSIKGGMSEFLQGGFYSRWWIGAIGFFVCLALVRKSAGKLKGDTPPVKRTDKHQRG